MTREAAATGLERFADDLLDELVAEFSVANALRGGRATPGSGLADRLVDHEGTLRRCVVEPRLAEYRRNLSETFEVVLACAAGTATVDDRAEALLAADVTTAALRSDASASQREAVRAAVLERYRRLVAALTPLVRSPADEFWVAVTRELDEGAALDLVDETFAFADPFVDHREAFVFRERLDPGEVFDGVAGLLGDGLPPVEIEYTEEAIRAMRRAESTVAERVRRDVRRRFGDG